MIYLENSVDTRQGAPLQDILIAYKSTVFKNLTANRFAGPPTPEIDAAWDALLEPVNLRVSENELQRAGQSSVALLEGGGYLAWLQSFHEIHCIVSLRAYLNDHASNNYGPLKKMLRQWNYRDYYHPNISAEQETHMASHAGMSL